MLQQVVAEENVSHPEGEEMDTEAPQPENCYKSGGPEANDIVHKTVATGDADSSLLQEYRETIGQLQEEIVSLQFQVQWSNS